MRDRRPRRATATATTTGRSTMQGCGCGGGSTRPRGGVLFSAACSYNLVRDGLVNWTDHDRIFGLKVGAAEWADYLRGGPARDSCARASGPRSATASPAWRRPLSDARRLHPGPQHQGYMRAPRAGRRPRSLAVRRHAAADLALLHGYFRQRAANRPRGAALRADPRPDLSGEVRTW